MSQQEHDILNNDDDQLDARKLINYLEGRLPDAEHKAIEDSISHGSEFLQEAMEGLEAVTPQTDLNQVVLQLNKQLKQQLSAKKQRRQHHQIHNLQWLWVAIVIILAVCISGYFIYHRIKHG